MNFLQRLRFLIFGTQYVLIRDKGVVDWDTRPVTFILGTPFTRRVYSNGMMKLLQGGEIDGRNNAFNYEWSPATTYMNLYFNPPAE